MKKYGTPEKVKVLNKESSIINRFLKKVGKLSFLDLKEDEKEELNKEIKSEKGSK